MEGRQLGTVNEVGKQMPVVIKAADPQRVPQASRFNFDDMAQQAQSYLGQVRGQAEQIVQQARQEAENIRKQAEQEGRASGQRAMDQLVEQHVGKQMESLLPALKQAVAELQQARHDWLVHWQERAVSVATAIAGRIVRREIAATPGITLTLVKEALDLAAGRPEVRLKLNPADHQSLAGQVRQIIAEVSKIGSVEVVADAAVSAGGCRIETRHGSIDQCIEAQLERIEAELTG
jgi:flagellar assembly protein FliH